MHFIKKDQYPEVVLEFPTLTICEGQVMGEVSGNFPLKEAVEWARKLMLEEENYHKFYLEYYYPSHDHDGNEINAYTFALLGTIPEVVYGEGINEITIKPTK